MSQRSVRKATSGDKEQIARLLDDFNREFDEPTPGTEVLTRRVTELMRSHDDVFLVAGDPPLGLAYLRFRPALWAEALECWLAELYVVPDRRGEGFGRELMEAALEEARERGAAWIELGTEEDDIVARKLYEKLGFRNTDGHGAQMLFYEREL